jgi:hypothetical protein
MVGRRQSLFAWLGFGTLAVLIAAGGCGGSSKDTFGDDGGGGGASGGLNLGGTSGSSSGGCGSACGVNTNCPNGGHTTISGTVYDPAGKNPLNNVVLFVPQDPSQLPAIHAGTNSCNTCQTPIGNYVTAAISDAKGHFTLKDVPTGSNIPVVAQTGKWRYLFHVAQTADCADTTVPNGTARLPRNHTEGDMPQMALLTGGLDNLGCFLDGIGIAPSEFTAPKGGGRLDIYKGNAFVGSAPGVTGGTAGDCTGSSCPLWQSKGSLEGYDIVLLACEGSEFPASKPQSALTAMHDWLDEGGKVFATHYHYYWFEDGPADFKGVANWGNTGIVDAAFGAGSYTIDTSFAGGMTFDAWLGNVGALNTDGTITLSGVASSIDTVNAPTLRWIYGGQVDTTKYLSFGTPVGGVASNGGDSTKTYCGKAVLTDLHAGDAPTGDVPGSCSGGALTAQEKALEFLFFDLAACVRDETVPMTTLPPPQ